MKGVFTYNDLPKAGVKLYIVDAEDNRIDSVTTGVDGSFKFSELTPNKAYMLKVADGMVADPNGIDVFFVNQEGDPVMRAGVEEGERFSFEAMDEGDLASLQVLHQEVAGQGKMLYRRESMDGEYIKGGEADEDAMRGFELVDGTPDSKDKPRDPKEALYNVSFEKETIFFEHNKYSIDQNQDGSKGSVIAKKLKANPAMRIEIQGYASQPGTEAYNLLLSQRRADELKRLLVEKYGIDPGRIVPVGKGEDPAVTEQEARRARIIILE
jgi:outer membrane protein OmpA-like peptidoglycan-associated protein